MTERRDIRKLQKELRRVSGGTGQTGPAGADGEGVPVGGTAGQFLAKIDATDFNTHWVSGGGGGVTAWTGLTDTPSNFTGQGDKWIKVNAGATALEFIDAPTDNVTFLGLTDTPGAYVADNWVKVNNGGTALEFVAAPTDTDTFVGLTDTPANYTGQAGKFIKVNVGATALEFTDAPSGGGGGPTLIGSATTVSATELLIDSGTNISTYDEVYFIIAVETVSTADDLRVQFRSGGATIGGSTYEMAGIMYLSNHNLPSTEFNTNSSSFIDISREKETFHWGLRSSGGAYYGRLALQPVRSDNDQYNFTVNATYKAVFNTDPALHYQAGGHFDHAGEVQGIRVYTRGGNNIKGFVKMIGVTYS